MTRAICLAIGLWWLGGVMRVDAQDVPPSEQVPAPPVPEPPAGYAPSTTQAQTATGASATPSLAALPPQLPDPFARRRFNLWLGLGIGDAAGCGNNSLEEPCAIDGAGTLALGADFRFHPNFSVGLELAAWSFSVSDTWRGQLEGMPDKDKTSIGATYLALFGRWYWFDAGIVDPYIHLGIGGGSITATLANDVDSYTYKSSGVDTQLGAGVEFHVHPAVRLGPQLLASVLVSNEVCEQRARMKEMCRKPVKNAKGDQEGNLFAWRFMLIGTVMLGER